MSGQSARLRHDTGIQPTVDPGLRTSDSALPDPRHLIPNSVPLQPSPEATLVVNIIIGKLAINRDIFCKKEPDCPCDFLRVGNGLWEMAFLFRVRGFRAGRGGSRTARVGVRVIMSKSGVEAWQNVAQGDCGGKSAGVRSSSPLQRAAGSPRTIN